MRKVVDAVMVQNLDKEAVPHVGGVVDSDPGGDGEQHLAPLCNTAWNVSKSSSFFGTRIRTYQPSDWPANKVVL